MLVLLRRFICICLGLYPVVGWKIGPDVVYLAEGNAADTGTAIKWAQELGESYKHGKSDAYNVF